MNESSQQVLYAGLGALLAAVACYVILRWAVAALLVRLGSGIECAVNVVALVLLFPEHWWSRAQRRITGRPAPFAYAYGDAVCAVANAGHEVAGIVLSALHAGAMRLTHRSSCWGAALAAGLSLWFVLG
ncbi:MULTISPECIES: hypothetical protein [unclassified Streptomyces]|uniref:hypothetical protein n=1 Tax=unclassified Streptomyces TaxID=2593676 RepID=UPI0010125D61|nr:hypothetical protein [Streptomyces sp. GZWMJZ-114]